jgi:hypothetical protein
MLNGESGSCASSRIRWVGTGKLGAETMANHQERSWTKALAEHYARRSIQGRDAIAASQEYFRRLRMRGTECRLTADDKKAIA